MAATTIYREPQQGLRRREPQPARFVQNRREVRGRPQVFGERAFHVKKVSSEEKAETLTS